jgi:hypothetical protein
VTTEEKARRLIGDAWSHFWRHCGDPGAYYEDYIKPEEFDAVMKRADAILEAK